MKRWCKERLISLLNTKRMLSAFIHVTKVKVSSELAPFSYKDVKSRGKASFCFAALFDRQERMDGRQRGMATHREESDQYTQHQRLSCNCVSLMRYNVSFFLAVELRVSLPLMSLSYTAKNLLRIFKCPSEVCTSRPTALVSETPA